MRKTKMICGIGPATQDWEVFKALVKNGMNVVRVNFSHATMEERHIDEELTYRARKELGEHVAILYDTKGPDLRTCNFENDSIEFIAGNTIRIVRKAVLGNQERISLNYPQVIDNLKVGTTILLNDGFVRLEVISVEDDGSEESGVTCKILDDATLISRRGVNIPGVDLNIPFVSEDDEADIKYACDHDGDFLGISFVSSAEDVKAARALLTKYGKPEMQILSKIETAKAIDNIDEIIDETDGIIVARGDLSVEVPFIEVPILQKEIVRKCREKGKICIVATEMLKSMCKNSRPTKAELTDVATAVFDGADAVWLSDETTIGAHPDLASQYLGEISEVAEHHYKEYARKYDIKSGHKTHDLIAESVVTAAEDLDVKVIVAATMSGYTAQKISNLKPDALILATVPNEKVARRLVLNWGVYPVVSTEYNSTDELVEDGIMKAKEFMELTSGDKVVITGGFPNTGTKTTNFMKIEQI